MSDATSPAPVAPLHVEATHGCAPTGTMHSQPAFRPGVQPVFIVGAPRSGTSIMTWAIGHHPNIQAMPETAWISSLAVGAASSHALGASRGRFSHLSNVGYPLEAFLRRLGESVHDIVHDCFEERCRLCYGDDYRTAGKLTLAPDVPNPGMHLRQSVDDPKRRWIDGTPLNSHYAWALAQMFPEARFIHNLRRPDEVATSLEGFAKVGADPQELADGLRTWYQHTEAAWLAERAFGADRVFRLHFARIGGEPEAMLRDVCAFLGEDFSPSMLRPLGKRLNSSQVDDKRAANLARLHDLPAFRAAQELYAAVLRQPPAEPDASALAELRQRFDALSEGRTLV
jgi:hypothetical protein